MNWRLMVAGGMLAGVVLAGGTGLEAGETKAKPETVTRARLVTLTATVEAVDVAKRQVTLKGPEGNVVTITVGEQVKNLPQVQVGDKVVVKYYEAIAFRVVPPGEATPGAGMTAATATAQPGQKPAGVGAREVTATVTVEAIDLKAGTATVKGPEGNSVTVKAQDKKNLEKIKVGDRVEITYTEALGISVSKAK
jgi:ribosomal 50S subunit-recycling heat shock protein